MQTVPLAYPKRKGYLWRLDLQSAWESVSGKVFKVQNVCVHIYYAWILEWKYLSGRSNNLTWTERVIKRIYSFCSVFWIHSWVHLSQRLLSLPEKFIIEALKLLFFYATVPTALPHPSEHKDEGKKLCTYTLIGDKYTKSSSGHFLCTSLATLVRYFCPLCLKCIGCFVKLLAENCASHDTPWKQSILKSLTAFCWSSWEHQKHEMSVIHCYCSRHGLYAIWRDCRSYKLMS